MFVVFSFVKLPWLVSAGSEEGQVASCCEHGDEISRGGGHKSAGSSLTS